MTDEPTRAVQTRDVERGVRALILEDRKRAMGGDFWAALFRPRAGDESGRVSEVGVGEDGRLTEARDIAGLFGQTWVGPSIDTLLAYRTSWRRKGRTEAIIAFAPPPEGAESKLAESRRGILGRIPFVGRFFR